MLQNFDEWIMIIDFDEFIVEITLKIYSSFVEFVKIGLENFYTI